MYATEPPFFRASLEQPYHLSVGGVLFNDKGQIACHHFKDVFGVKDLYILMRETMENGEAIFETLHRGLREEFGATAIPIAFIGGLSGELCEPNRTFDKTTLYIACQVKEWSPEKRDQNDPEAMSTLEWHAPETLMEIMKNQGERFKRHDVDESEMIRRALPFIQQAMAES